MKLVASTAVAITIFSSFANANVEVIQYDGPTECEIEERVQSLYYVKLHYIGSIDYWSKTGEKGKVFDSSYDRHTLDFQFDSGTGQGIRGMLEPLIIYTPTTTMAFDESVPTRMWKSSMSRIDLNLNFHFCFCFHLNFLGINQGINGLCVGSKATITVLPKDEHDDGGLSDYGVPPGATLHFDVEIVSVASDKPDDTNLFLELDLDESGDISRFEIEEYMDLVLGRSKIPEGLFENQDTDRDGYISWEEFTGPKGDYPPPSTLNAFEIIDTDKSGYLSREELEVFALEVHGRSVPDHIWKREDKDSDGKVSWEEFTGAKGRKNPNPPQLLQLN